MPSLSSLGFERFSHLPAVLPGSPVENWRHVEGPPSLLSLAPAQVECFDHPVRQKNAKLQQRIQRAAASCSCWVNNSSLLSRLSSAEQSYWTIIQSMRFQLQRACDKLSSKVCTNSDRCLKSHQRQGPLKLKSETSLKSYAPASKMPFHYQLNLCHCCLVPLLLNYCYAMISQNCRPTLVDFGFEHDINP